jgi:hypothetical protein
MGSLVNEESKKRTKKTLVLLGHGVARPRCEGIRSLFAAFSSEKEVLASFRLPFPDGPALPEWS